MQFLRRAVGGEEAKKPMSETEELIARILSAHNDFEVLDIPVTPCAPVVIKKLYRRLALKVHPDKCQHEDAERAFKRLNDAHTALSDERRQRDALGAARDEKMQRDAAGLRARKAETEAAREAEERARAAERERRAFQQRCDDEKRRRDRADARAAKAEKEARVAEEKLDAERRAAREAADREAVEKEERRREKKALQRAKRRLRAARDALSGGDDDDDDDDGDDETADGDAAAAPSAEDVEFLCEHLDTAALEDATMLLLRGGTLEAVLSECRERVDAARRAAAEAEAARKDARRAAAAAAAAKKALENAWSDVETAALLRSARKIGAPAPETLA